MSAQQLFLSQLCWDITLSAETPGWIIQGLTLNLGSAFLGDSEAPGEVARVRTRELGRENRRLQDLATQLQEKHHRISLEVGIRASGCS